MTSTTSQHSSQHSSVVTETLELRTQNHRLARDASGMGRLLNPLLIAAAVFGSTLTNKVVVGQVTKRNFATDVCRVIGYKVLLPSGVPTSEPWGLVREVSTPLEDGFLVCADVKYGRNIEAVTTGNCTANSIRLILEETTDGIPVAIAASRVERLAPYTLYGDDPATGTIMSGNFVNLTSSKSYKLSAFPVGHRHRAYNVSFDTVLCSNFAPPNQCLTCATSDKMCEGSTCVGTGYIRISVMTYGFDQYDHGVTVTTPAGGVFGEYREQQMGGINLPTSDPLGSGGFVEVNSMNPGGCRSMGVWTKNILFPNPDTAPKGTYTVSIADYVKCWFPGATTRSQPFVLKVVVDDILVGMYNQADGYSFTFNID